MQVKTSDQKETFANLCTLQEAEQNVFAIRWILVQRQPESNASDYKAVLQNIIRNAREAINNLK